MPHRNFAFWAGCAAIFVLTVVVYLPGLAGPFLFDDHVHITQNRWVKIEHLNWHDLTQAYNSSFNAFPSDRPLAQLSFGITHALAGLNPIAFKGANLTLHLLTGVVIYHLALLVFAATRSGRNETSTNELRMAAMATAALWLLHPLQVSTVLYSVQRMAQGSTLFLLLGMLSYVSGRLRIARGESGCLRMLAAAPLAAVGFLFKENAVLMPLLLLSAELSLLARVPKDGARNCINAIKVAFIAVPLIAAVTYVATHPGLLGYDNRDFTLAERAMTEPRVLWTYLRWLFVPDISMMGLYHDDLVVSRGWLTPPTTAPAALALALVFAAALVLRKRAPLFAFAVLFFLAAHALESTIFPLELMFEHRNYLAFFGPMLLFAYVVVVKAHQMNVSNAAFAVGALLLVAYAGSTYVRANNWSSYERFASTTVSNHPQSQRANFMAAQLLITAAARDTANADALAAEADAYLTQGLAINPDCLNCLFAKIALQLNLGRLPPAAVVDRLVNGLRSGKVGPTDVSVTQFSYLSRWHRSDGIKLPPEQITAIYESALANPGWNRTGRAGVAGAYREYLEFVSGDLAAAEAMARESVRAWPEQWRYHAHLIQVLRKRGHIDRALAALEAAGEHLRNAQQQAEYRALMNDILSGSQKDTHATD